VSNTSTKANSPLLSITFLACIHSRVKSRDMTLYGISHQKSPPKQQEDLEDCDRRDSKAKLEFQKASTKNPTLSTNSFPNLKAKHLKVTSSAMAAPPLHHSSSPSPQYSHGQGYECRFSHPCINHLPRYVQITQIPPIFKDFWS
jgi:hypothetical protein